MFCKYALEERRFGRYGRMTKLLEMGLVSSSDRNPSGTTKDRQTVDIKKKEIAAARFLMDGGEKGERHQQQQATTTHGITIR